MIETALALISPLVDPISVPELVHCRCYHGAGRVHAGICRVRQRADYYHDLQCNFRPRRCGRHFLSDRASSGISSDSHGDPSFRACLLATLCHSGVNRRAVRDLGSGFHRPGTHEDCHFLVHPGRGRVHLSRMASTERHRDKNHVFFRLGAGLVQGAAGVGGPPVVALVLSRPGDAETQRANVIGTVSALALSSPVPLWYYGLFTPSVLILSLVLFPLFTLSVWAGARFFSGGGQRHFRGAALLMLAVIGMITLGLAVQDYIARG